MLILIIFMFFFSSLDVVFFLSLYIFIIDGLKSLSIKSNIYLEKFLLTDFFSCICTILFLFLCLIILLLFLLDILNNISSNFGNPIFPSPGFVVFAFVDG